MHGNAQGAEHAVGPTADVGRAACCPIGASRGVASHPAGELPIITGALLY